MYRRSRARIPIVPGNSFRHPARALDTSGWGRTEPRMASGSRLAVDRKRVTRGRSIGIAGRTDTPLVPPELQEVVVEPAVMGELRMERRRQEVVLPRRDDRRRTRRSPRVVQLRQDLDPGTDRLDQRRADEHRM